jgi:hypothetical protein
MKTVLFIEQNLNERGTAVSTYNYAKYNEEILGNRSIIASIRKLSMVSYDKFASRFPVFLMDSASEIDAIVEREHCDYSYIQVEGGSYDPWYLTSKAKNLLHVVFPFHEPHGDSYVYISKWLGNMYGLPYVPYMVDVPKHGRNLRKDLGIDENTLVFGWYGGNNFEIDFARQAVVLSARARKDAVFIFMNQQPFCEESNVIFIPGTNDLEYKVSFVNTCDAMIHARTRGETFGLAIAEFSSGNKPIITYGSSPERSHNDILGDKGIYYNNFIELSSILLESSRRDFIGDWNCYTQFTPEKVMQQFNTVFLS